MSEPVLDSETMPDVTSDSVRLPNQYSITSIISKMQKFSLKSAIPPNLNYVLNEEDVDLEKNIQKLFGSELWDIQAIQEVLVRIVQQEDDLMHPRQKREVARDIMRKISSNEKKQLSLFYPNLVRVIIAVMVHVHNNRPKVSNGVEQESTTKNLINDIWKNTLSELDRIRMVILYGNESNDFLGEYPTDLNKLVQERKMQIYQLQTMEHAHKASINAIEKDLNERDQEIEVVRSKYASKESELDLLISKKRSTEEKLRQLLDVRLIVKNNIEQLENNFPLMEKKTTSTRVDPFNFLYK